MKPAIVTILIAVLTILGAKSTLGYVLIGFKWPEPFTEMQLGLGSPWNTAFIEAGNRWNQSSLFKFTYTDLASDSCSTESPRKNGVQFSDSVCGESFGASTLAVSIIWTTSTSSTGNKKVALQSSVIFKNGINWAIYDGPWSTGQWAGQSDFRRVAVHELGHVIGFGHDTGFTIMSSAVSTGSNILGPQPTDIAGVNDLYTGSTDTTGPEIVITSHRDIPSVVGTDTITVEGTVSDAYTGGWGVSSVTVNGIPAEGGIASGLETGNWRQIVPLHLGTNLITVSARDNSFNRNVGSAGVSVAYKLPNGETSGISGIYHVFPRFASGRLLDGTRYRSTLMIRNPSLFQGPVAPTCVLRIYGLPPNIPNTFTYTVSAPGWFFEPLEGIHEFQSGYATLSCTQSVDAQVLYSFYDQNERKLSEATIFSSPSSSKVQILADNRDAARTAFALANDSDRNVDCDITVTDASGAVVGTVQLSLNAKTSLAQFIDELLPLPVDFYGRFLVSIDGPGISLIGLRYTNGIFATIPQTVRGGEIQLTASKSHVFPRFANGFLSDGSSFKTTLMVSSPLNVPVDCTVSLYQQGSPRVDTFAFTLGATGWYISPLVSGDAWKDGFATLQCSSWVDAQLLYSFYSPDGVKLSEATVFSSPSAPAVEFLGDSRDGERIAIAIANDTDEAVDYALWITHRFGNEIFSSVNGVLNIGPRSSRAGFLDEFFTGQIAPVDGPVYVSAKGRLSVIGFRFTGGVFTTFSESVR